MDHSSFIEQYLEKEIQVLRSLDLASVDRALNLIAAAHGAGNRIYIFGNGGSAAAASHFACDFNKSLSEGLDRKFNFICLNDNIPTLMAIANDLDFQEVFRFQLRGRLAPGDLVMAISGSGNSANVIAAVEYAQSLGHKVIGLTGCRGGRLRDLADVSLHVPAESMQISEDVHLILNHMMVNALHRAWSGPAGEAP